MTFVLGDQGQVARIVSAHGNAGAQAEKACTSAITSRAPYGEWTDDMQLILGPEQQLTFTSTFSNMSNESPQPDPAELRLLGVAGRLQRLRDQGLSLEEAVRALAKKESAEEYVARNQQALGEVEARMLSPEYLERFAEANSDPDPESRARKLAELKRENYATLDLEALHRHISARNKQCKAEGVLPPDAPT